MPKYYCDYCDIFLTHDSASVRKSHNAGWKHKMHVRNYYIEFAQELGIIVPLDEMRQNDRERDKDRRNENQGMRGRGRGRGGASGGKDFGPKPGTSFGASGPINFNALMRSSEPRAPPIFSAPPSGPTPYDNRPPQDAGMYNRPPPGPMFGNMGQYGGPPTHFQGEPMMYREAQPPDQYRGPPGPPGPPNPPYQTFSAPPAPAQKRPIDDVEAELEEVRRRRAMLS